MNFIKQPLYIGRLPTADPDLERPGKLHSNDFIGCMHSVSINSRASNLSQPYRLALERWAHAQSHYHKIQHWRDAVLPPNAQTIFNVSICRQSILTGLLQFNGCHFVVTAVLWNFSFGKNIVARNYSTLQWNECMSNIQCQQETMRKTITRAKFKPNAKFAWRWLRCAEIHELDLPHTPNGLIF